MAKYRDRPLVQVNLSSTRVRKQEVLNLHRSIENTTGSYIERRDSPFVPYVESSRQLDPTVAPFLPFEHHEQKQIPAMQQVMPPVVYTESQQYFRPTHPPNTEATTLSLSEGGTLSQEMLIRIWMSARAQIASLRAMTLATRTSVKRERYQRYQQEEEFEKILEEFMDVVGISSTQDPDPQSRYTLSRLSLELKASKLNLKTIRERAATLEDNLSNYEYHLERVEQDIYLELNEELQRSQDSYGMGFQSSSAQPIIPCNSSVDKSIGLRDRLYSRMGDLRIYLERLNNFEYDLREELDERDLIRASGETGMTTDTQFFEQTRIERAKIKQDLDRAQEDVRELKKKCLRDGIHFEEPQFAEMPFYSETESSTTTFDPCTQTVEEPQGSSSIIGAFFSAQERVKRWLKEPSGSPNSAKEGAGEVPDERGRRESASSDMGWVMTPSNSKRPASMRAAGKHGSAVHDTPEWRYGPRPGSPLLEALLLESAATPLGTYGHQPEVHATPKAESRLPNSRPTLHLSDLLQDA